MDNLIFDRTLADVEKVIEIKNKIRKNEPLAANEEAAYFSGELKGGYTYTDLNMVEAAMLTISNLLNECGYSNNIVTKVNWGVSDIFTAGDMGRWESNLNTLRGIFSEYGDTPLTPNSFRPYTNANDIEKILYDLNELIIKMKQNWRYANDVIAGEGYFSYGS